MRIRIGKVLPGLAVCIAMGASASPPLPPAVAANQAGPGRHPDAGPGLRVAFQYGSPGTREVASRLPGSEIRPAPPIDGAKTSALVLSSLGMLSLIALLRLNRTL